MRRLLVRFRLAALNSVERDATGEFQSGQMGQTVNLLSLDFGGSNPSSPTRQDMAMPGNRCLRYFLETTLLYYKEGQVALIVTNKVAGIAQLIEH